jgi:hypothetical protein
LLHRVISFSASVTRLGKISPFGRNFLALGAFFLKNVAQMIWEKFFSKKSPEIHLISSRFGLLFVLKFPNFDQKFVWE